MTNFAENKFPITMKKIMLILLAAAVMLFAGCSKEKDIEPTDNGRLSYHVSIGDWTQTAIASASLAPTTDYEMKVGDVRQVSVTPIGSSPEPESFSVSFDNDCFSWDSVKNTVKAEKTGNATITVQLKVKNSNITARFGVSISDH